MCGVVKRQVCVIWCLVGAGTHCDARGGGGELASCSMPLWERWAELAMGSYYWMAPAQASPLPERGFAAGQVTFPQTAFWGWAQVTAAAAEGVAQYAVWPLLWTTQFSTSG